MPRNDRVELWKATHNALQHFATDQKNAESLRVNIGRLRNLYEEMASGLSSPKFAEDGLRDAYMVAYHPGHAFMTHYVLDTDQYVGRHLDLDERRTLTVTVLGAGCGAETLALMAWVKGKYGSSLNGLTVNLLDIQDWASQRNIGLVPLIREDISSGRLKLNEFQADVCSPIDRNLIIELVQMSDLVFCPALLTELASDQDRSSLLTTICSSLRVGAKLVIVDQSLVNNFDSFVGNAHHIQQVAVLDGGRFTLAIQDQIPVWLSRGIMDGSDGLIPRSKYTWSWLICESPKDA
jgi:hypothetical protein